MKNNKCKYCDYSYIDTHEESQTDELMCNQKKEAVDPNHNCFMFERYPGGDDDAS